VKTKKGRELFNSNPREPAIKQNHVLTDVSAKHYDRWDYMPEKREALLKWAACLEEF